MPIWKPGYSPRLNPYGALRDITPEGLEDLFVQSKGGDPLNPPLEYRIKTSGEFRIFAYFGSVGFPKTFYFYMTDDGGESWEKKEFTFPAELLVDEAFVDSTFYGNELWFQTVKLLNPDRVSIETYNSQDFGETWDPAWSLSELPFKIQNHRIFPTSKGVYQVADVIDDTTGPPFITKLIGWKDGEKVLDQVTSPLIANGGITVSSYVSKYETGFFDLSFTTVLGGQEIWRVTGEKGFEFRGKLPESQLTIPISNPRPPLLQIWYLPKKGILYMPTLTNQGARLYTSFDEGRTFTEELGGLRIAIPALTTVGRRAIFEDPVTENEFRNEGFLTELIGSSFWKDVLDAYADGQEWHIGFEKRRTRRRSEFYLWELMNP